MRELLQYPFDAKLLMRKRKALRRELLSNDGLFEKRIAILGGSTTHDIAETMELFLLDAGIKPDFYESEYARFWEDAVFGNERLDAFNPDIVFVHTTVRNISQWPDLEMSPEEVERLLDATIERYETAWSKLAGKFNCPIIQNNFEYLPYRQLGNLDAAEIHGRTNFILRLNERIVNWAREKTGFFVNDINWQSADFGLAKWHDQLCWYMYKYALSIDAIPTLASNVANIVKAIFGKNKKAVALDLDNTLWGGVVGDDGAENLELGTETATGQAYVEFQRYLKQLKKQGVLLNVISKNEEGAAKAGLSHPSMVLKENDFVSIKANWESKSRNLACMAGELSLLPESFVFIDDNPAEREIIRQQVPGCSVPELAAVEGYIAAIDHGGYFESVGISRDDLKRADMYKANIDRAQSRISFPDYGAYLKSLEMRATVRPFEAVYMSRIAQLTNKSNQFNLTTRRYTQEEIEYVAGSEKFITRYGRLCDKFGDNGVVAVSICELKGDVGEIVLWLMSCRVLKRDMEYAMMDEVVEAAKSRGVRILRGFYRPTAKNAMVKNFYASQGFSLAGVDAQGNATWELDISKGYNNQNKYIEVER